MSASVKFGNLRRHPCAECGVVQEGFKCGRGCTRSWAILLKRIGVAPCSLVTSVATLTLNVSVVQEGFKCGRGCTRYWAILLKRIGVPPCSLVTSVATPTPTVSVVQEGFKCGRGCIRSWAILLKRIGFWRVSGPPPVQFWRRFLRSHQCKKGSKCSPGHCSFLSYIIKKR